MLDASEDCDRNIYAIIYITFNFFSYVRNARKSARKEKRRSKLRCTGEVCAEFGRSS